MNKSTTNTPILDDDQIAEIEAEPTRLNSRFETLVLLTPEKRDALCATVRALRAENERLTTVSGEWAGLIDRIRAWSKCADGYPLDEHINNITVDRERLRASRRVHELDNHHNALACGYCAGPIKEQLEQMTKELNEEKRLRAELKQISQAGIAEVSSVATALGDNALTDFRIRAVHLCRSKADEWAKQAEEAQALGIQTVADGKASRALAAQMIAAELKRLK